MALKETTKFVIVSFDNSTTEEGLKLTELVPRSWLQLAGNSWYCVYPPRQKYRFVDSWTRTSKDPDPEWVATEVHIVKEAGKYH